jgi:hypothetical protein
MPPKSNAPPTTYIVAAIRTTRTSSSVNLFSCAQKSRPSPGIWSTADMSVGRHDLEPWSSSMPGAGCRTAGCLAWKHHHRHPARANQSAGEVESDRTEPSTASGGRHDHEISLEVDRVPGQYPGAVSGESDGDAPTRRDAGRAHSLDRGAGVPANSVRVLRSPIPWVPLDGARDEHLRAEAQAELRCHSESLPWWFRRFEGHHNPSDRSSGRPVLYGQRSWRLLRCVAWTQENAHDLVHLVRKKTRRLGSQ